MRRSNRIERASPWGPINRLRRPPDPKREAIARMHMLISGGGCQNSIRPQTDRAGFRWMTADELLPSQYYNRSGRERDGGRGCRRIGSRPSFQFRTTDPIDDREIPWVYSGCWRYLG